MFNPSEYGYGEGTYNVRVRAYDEVLDHSFNSGMLDLVRSGYDALEQFVTWTFALSAPMPGDYNRDNVVDMLDYETWRRYFGSDRLLAADGSGNGIVDAADYVVWRRHFEANTQQTVPAAVPEPFTGWILTLGLVIFAAANPRRRLTRPTCGHAFSPAIALRL
jgi:hypothetical protein